MQIDERALNFIQKAKAAGFSQKEVYDELLAKGYEVGAPREEIQEWKAPEPEKSPYSTMDKVKYTLRAAGEAAPFGMGDLVAGVVGAHARNLADVTHGKDLKTRAKGLGKLAFGIVSPKDFKEERADFIKEQEEFAKHHGGLNFAGEMVGGLLTGGAGAARNVIGKQGIKALMNAGAREGAKFGAAYGAGSALTQDTDKISVPNALIGAGIGGAGGALIGAALPPAIALGGKGLKAGSNLVGRFFGTKKAAGREAQKILEQAGGTGVNEVVNADEGVVALKNAIKSDKGLAREIEQIADEKLINSADTTKQIISDTLGANDIQAAKDLASAQYRDVLASDPIYVPDNIYKNKGLKKAVKNAIKNDYNDELEKKGINSLYGVQAVKEELDDMIAKSMVIGKKGIAEPTKATARLQEVKAKFLENVDAVAPQYKQVREDFEKAIAPYNILGGLLKDQGRERANTIKAILTNKNKTAISDVFGKEKAEALFDALRKQSRLNENYNALYNAAHTELTKSTPIGNKAPWRESVESLGSIVGTVADMARFGGAKRLRRNIAEILLSGQKPSVKSPVKSIPQESGQSISGYLGGKLKEKGGYAWKDKGAKQILNSEGTPVATTEEGVKNFNKWFKGSKVVDEKGKPLVVYHGSAKDFDAFDIKRGGSNTLAIDSKGAAFFTSNRETAEGYAGRKEIWNDDYELYKEKMRFVRGALKEYMQNNKYTPEQKQKIMNYDDRVLKFFDKVASREQKKEFMSYDKRIADLEKRHREDIEKSKRLYEVYLKMENPRVVDMKGKEYNEDVFSDIIGKAKDGGYDGVIIKNVIDGVGGVGTDYVSFSPTQIKSVKNSGKFDPKNPNIYKSLIGGLGISQILKNKESK